MAKKERELKYLEHVIGKGKQISFIQVAEIVGMKRQSVYARLKRPFKEWKIGWLMQIADILGFEIGELCKYATEYEEAIEDSGQQPQSTRSKGQKE